MSAKQCLYLPNMSLKFGIAHLHQSMTKCFERKVSNMKENSHQWSNLPKELVEKISKHLTSPLDVLQLRAVCTSWRSSVSLPSFDQEIPPQILSLRSPTGLNTVLSKTFITVVDLINQNCPNSSSLISKRWLTKIGESKNGKLKLWHPITHCEIGYSPIPLNLLDFHFVRLCLTYKLEVVKLANSESENPYVLYDDGLQVFDDDDVGIELSLNLLEVERFCLYWVQKVVPFPISASCSESSKLSILAIFRGGTIGYWRQGYKYWFHLPVGDCRYDDIIEFRGQCYVVDRLGTISWIDSSLNLIQYSPQLNSCGAQKTLVESCGDLYIVDRFFDRKRESDYYGTSRPVYCKPKIIDVRIFKLNEEWGRWDDVKSIVDRVFVLGDDCSFSISCSDFNGSKGNCIYFADAGYSNAIRVFQLEDHSIKDADKFPEYSGIFWPPNIGLI